MPSSSQREQKASTPPISIQAEKEGQRLSIEGSLEFWRLLQPAAPLESYKLEVERLKQP